MRVTGRFLLAILGAWLALPMPARAATYGVEVCKGGTGSGASFETLNAALSSVKCPTIPTAPFGGLLAQDQLGAANHANGTRGGFTVTAPPGTTITNLAARRYFGKRSPIWDVAVRNAQRQIIETCDFNPAREDVCSQGSDTSREQSTAVYSQLSTSAVEFGFACRATPPGACSQHLADHRVWMVIYDATVTIDDPIAPVLAQPTGTLLQPGGPGGWHKGIETVTVSASDVSGIKRTDVTIGASRQNSVDQVCDYTRLRPCPASAAATHSVDLDALPDGPHQLRVSAADAANQVAYSDPIGLKIDSHAPSGPKGLRATHSGDGSWRVSWANPSQGTAAPIVAARYAVCRPAPSGECPIESKSAGVDISALDVRPPKAGGKWDALVWLEDEAANHDRGSGARVSLSAGTSLASRRRPRLRITRVIRTGRRLRVMGTIGKAVTGSVVVRVRARPAGAVLARGRARVRRGRWRISARLPRAVQRRRTALLTVGYGGDRRYAPQAITRRIGGR